MNEGRKEGRKKGRKRQWQRRSIIGHGVEIHSHRLWLQCQTYFIKIRSETECECPGLDDKHVRHGRPVDPGPINSIKTCYYAMHFTERPLSCKLPPVIYIYIE